MKTGPGSPLVKRPYDDSNPRPEAARELGSTPVMISRRTSRGRVWGRVVCQAEECGYSQSGFAPTLARLLRHHQSATGHSVTVTADLEGECPDPSDALRQVGLDLASVRLRAAALVSLAVSRDTDGFERLLRDWGNPEA
jgi:hypothetical protein